MEPDYAARRAALLEDLDGLRVDVDAERRIGTLTLDRAPVPPAHLVAGSNQAAEACRQLQDLTLLGLGAGLLGIMETALDMSVEYMKIRNQFDRPIGSFQALQHIVVDEFINVEIAKSFVYRVCASMDFGQEDSAMAAAVKASTSGGALSVAKNAIQLHGGIGYTDEHDIGLYLKRVAALAAQYGNQATQIDRYAQLTNAVAVG